LEVLFFFILRNLFPGTKHDFLRNKRFIIFFIFVVSAPLYSLLLTLTVLPYCAAGFVLTPTSVQVSFARTRGRNHREAVGQVAWTFPQSTRSRSQNENRSRTSARARRGVVSANEKKEKRKKRNFQMGNMKIGQNH
jgi:hypothetical protein